MALNLLRLLVVGLVLLMLGCGSGGGSSSPPPATGTPSPGTPAPVTTGALNIAVTGLPAGANGQVTVTGPASYSRTLTQTETLSNLTAGTYTVAAASVAAGGSTLQAAPATQSVAVTAGGAASASVAYTAAAPFALGLQQVASGLAAPTFLTAPAGDPRIFIVERAGRIRVLQNGTVQSSPFLDISAKTTTDGERGLLSLAFHPQYASNGQFFVYYTDTAGSIAIERYTVQGINPNAADPGSALRILTVPHPGASNHNGGLVAFGPDGYLYAALGDGGGGGDPSGNAQNNATLLGKMVRLNVNAASAATPYIIPADNPFATVAGARPEIWAKGLRNPWRFAFDPASAQLIVADVGQNKLEEINAVAASAAGLNYGWNIMEASECYNATTCNRSGLTLPALEYDHTGGNCSITGGYVYRGSALPELTGRFFYADLCGGVLKSARFSGGVASERTDYSVGTIAPVWSFGQDGQNELYIVAGSGNVYRLVRR